MKHCMLFLLLFFMIPTVFMGQDAEPPPIEDTIQMDVETAFQVLQERIAVLESQLADSKTTVETLQAENESLKLDAETYQAIKTENLLLKSIITDATEWVESHRDTFEQLLYEPVDSNQITPEIEEEVSADAESP